MGYDMDSMLARMTTPYIGERTTPTSLPTGFRLGPAADGSLQVEVQGEVANEYALALSEATTGFLAGANVNVAFGPRQLVDVFEQPIIEEDGTVSTQTVYEFPSEGIYIVGADAV